MFQAMVSIHFMFAYDTTYNENIIKTYHNQRNNITFKQIYMLSRILLLFTLQQLTIQTGLL